MEKTTGESNEGDEPESSIIISRSKNMVKYSLLCMLTLKILFKKQKPHLLNFLHFKHLYTCRVFPLFKAFNIKIILQLKLQSVTDSSFILVVGKNAWYRFRKTLCITLRNKLNARK